MVSEPPVKILLQTTTAPTEDDWHAGRFSLLKSHLESLSSADGAPLYAVTARDRGFNENGDDPVLSTMDQSEYDQLWLFAVDTGKGLTGADCGGITRFRQRGGGILSARDHQDLGSSLCTLGGIGMAHFFHTTNPEPDVSRRVRDDQRTTNIDYPNYHSGDNGDFQQIHIEGPAHELLLNVDGSHISYFPAHPHEGAVDVPRGDHAARVIATGKSEVTGRPFNLVVAFERSTDIHGNDLGRAVAHSSFHHLADYNWNPEAGCPSFVEEKPGTGYRDHPGRLNDIKCYVENLAAWL